MTDNFVRSFLVDSKSVRGKFVKLGSNLTEIISKHNYPDQVSKLLAECLLAATMLGNDLKNKDGIITLHISSSKKVSFLVVDVTGSLNIRGYAEFDDIDNNKEYDFNELLGGGNLVITIDLDGSLTNRYQGIVELNGNSITEIISNYIAQSEQIETLIKIGVEKRNNEWIGNSIMIQKLPESSDENNWEEIKIFTQSLTDKELMSETLSDTDILKRLYGTHDIILFDQHAVGNKCRCSPLRALKVLKSLPQEELETLKVDGKLIVKCQFCNTESVFEHI